MLHWFLGSEVNSNLFDFLQPENPYNGNAIITSISLEDNINIK